ncbi:hypothetical protein J6590_074328 [Homalodisca vitripennis]|nr:hypothetical protein J6590_074328 [Homalodisca vitripennis]
MYRSVTQVNEDTDHSVHEDLGVMYRGHSGERDPDHSVQEHLRVMYRSVTQVKEIPIKVFLKT